MREQPQGDGLVFPRSGALLLRGFVTLLALLALLLHYDGMAQRYGLTRRYVRDTLTKRPNFPAPAMRVSQKLVSWRVADTDKYFAKTAKK